MGIGGCVGTGVGSCICCAGLAEGSGGGTGSGSCRGGWGDSTGIRASCVAGCGGVCDTAVGAGVTGTGDDSGRGMDVFRDSCSSEAAEGARVGGGGVGAAVVEEGSRFVVMATDMMIGGGAIGAVCIMVIWTVGIDGGTSVICERAEIGAVAGVDGLGRGGGPPCRSSFFCSSVAIRVLTRAMLRWVSSGLPMRSLCCRCS